MMRLQASIDYQRPAATPVFLLDKRINAIDVCRWIGTGERHPQEVFQRPGDKIAVINNDDERKSAEGGFAGNCRTETTDLRRFRLWSAGCGLRSSGRQTLNHND